MREGDDKMAVCDAHGRKIHVHKADGSDVLSIEIPTLLSTVRDVAWYGGRLFVTECCTENGRVFTLSVYDDGRIKRATTIEVGYKPAGGIAVSDRHMYVTSHGENLVYRLDTPDGTNKRVFARFSAVTCLPQFIAVNDRHVAVSCPGNDTVVLFDTDGAQQFEYGGPGSGPGQLHDPRGVAFDRYGRMLISDYYNRRISVVSTQGHGLHLQDIRLDQDGPRVPLGLAVSMSGQVVVGCVGENVIVVYNCV